MDAQAYLELLTQRLERYFDYKEPSAHPLPFDLVAELNAADEGYFMIKKLKTYTVKHDEYLFLKIFNEQPAASDVQPYLELMQQYMRELKTTTEHMSSLFSLVLVCQQDIETDLAEKLQRYKFHKDYAFTLKGWSDLAIYLVSLEQGTVLCNKAGQKNLPYFQTDSN